MRPIVHDHPAAQRRLHPGLLQEMGRPMLQQQQRLNACQLLLAGEPFPSQTPARLSEGLA